MIQTMNIESQTVTLPNVVFEKLRGQEIRFIEYPDGFVITPLFQAIRQARGCLKARRFSTERYFQMKQAEKERER